MLRKTLLLLLLICFALPMSANAADEIRLSDCGKFVIMPVEVFRAREGDLQKYEALQEYALKLEGLAGRLRDQLTVLEVNIAQERRAASYFVRDEKRKAGAFGFVAGAIVGGLVAR